MKPDPDAVEKAIGVAKVRGWDVIDNRSKHGTLWIVAPKSAGSKLARFDFQFKAEGGKATGGRPAWLLRAPSPEETRSVSVSALQGGAIETNRRRH